MPTYYQRPPTPDEIYHHGILGQKWGKKNGPPYPLKAEDHSSAEKKAGYQKSINSKKSDLRGAYAKLSKVYDTARKRDEKALKNLDKQALSKHGKTMEDLYDQAMKEDRNIPYEKSTWKKINDLEEPFYEQKRISSHEDYKKAEKVADKFVENWMKKYSQLNISELRSLSTKNKNSEHYSYDYEEVEALLNHMSERTYNKYKQYMNLEGY